MRGIFSMIFGTLLAVGLVLPMAKPALAQSSVEAGYQSIMQQGIIFGNICPSAKEPCPCRDRGECSVEHALQIFVNFSIFLMALAGTAAFAIFIWAGWKWITAQGDAKAIQEGKDAMVKATMGLAIIFGAYAFVNFLIAAVTGVEPKGTIEETIEQVIPDTLDAGKPTTTIDTVTE